MISRTFFFLATTLLLIGCKPEKIAIEMYSSDIKSVLSGEVVEVPVQISFNVLGRDEENNLEKMQSVSKPFLSQKTQFSISKASVGKNFVIETTLPMGTKQKLDEYLKTNKRVAKLEINTQNNEQVLVFGRTGDFAALDKELRKLKITSGISLPAHESTVRIVSDTNYPVQLAANAVFVLKKPYLEFSRTLLRRESVEIVFSGRDGSVYSEIEPQVRIKF